jgi:hypothetical protein
MLLYPLEYSISKLIKNLNVCMNHETVAVTMHSIIVAMMLS